MKLGYLLLCLCVSSVIGDPLKVLVIGDWGNDNNDQKRVAETMGEWAAEYGAHFIIATGDNFYDDGVISPEDPRFNTTWRDIYVHPGIINLPWYISVGNHDHRLNGNEWYQVFYSTRDPKWTMPDLTFSFAAIAENSLVRFVALDTQSIRRDKNNKEYMLEYLEDEVARDADWKIAFGHHPAYSCGAHLGTPEVREEVQPILLDHDVDFLITGHDHSHQHWQRTAGTDMDFVISGGGGRHVHNFDEDKRLEEEARGVTLRNFTRGHGFMYLEIYDTQATFTFISDEGDVGYSYTRTKNVK